MALTAGTMDLIFQSLMRMKDVFVVCQGEAAVGCTRLRDRRDLEVDPELLQQRFV